MEKCRADCRPTGAVPGPKDQLIRVADAIAKPWPKGPMTLAEVVPAAIAPAGAGAETTPEAAVAA
jgi:large subunit ribosomal protein L3